MLELYWAVLLASLIGSPHCAGMCGGLVAFCVGGSTRNSRWWSQISYHGGRLISYSLLGAIAGFLGAGIDLGGSAVGIKQAAAVFAGAFMIAFGVVALMRIRGWKLPLPKLPPLIGSGFTRATKVASGMPPVRRSLVIGLLTAFLPCGWLYAFVVTAAAAANPIGGAMVLAAFWLGTVPVLAVLGTGIHFLAGSLSKYLPTATALLLMAVGLWTVMGRLSVPDYTQKVANPSSVQEALEHVHGVNEQEAPCCDQEQ